MDLILHSTHILAVKPEVEMDVDSFQYNYESTRAAFEWQVTAGEPDTLELWYRYVASWFEELYLITTFLHKEIRFSAVSKCQS